MMTESDKKAEAGELREEMLFHLVDEEVSGKASSALKWMPIMAIILFIPGLILSLFIAKATKASLSPCDPGACAKQYSLRFSPAENLKIAQELFAQDAYLRAEAHLRAIPESAPEHTEAARLQRAIMQLMAIDPTYKAQFFDIDNMM